MLFNAEFFFGAIVILVGLAVELVGWKIHQQIVSVSGFIVGLVVGDFIWSQVFYVDYIFWRIFILATFSIIFFVLFFVYIRISIGVTLGIVGALIVSGFTSSRTIADWSLNYVFFQTNYNYPVLVIAFAISSYAGYRFFKLGYIILSTGIGSILVAYGGIISGLWTYNYLGIFLLLSLLLGSIVQLSQEGIIRERRLQIMDFKYCPKCGKLIDKNSAICSKCGRPVSGEEN
jgi:hypothetical protein